jgi:hypothetical protein
MGVTVRIHQDTGGGTGGASPLTTKGDLYTYATDDARLPLGANGQALVANNSTTTGLEWQTLSIYGVKLKNPTETEWGAERTSWVTDNAAGAFGSVLKLPMAGFRVGSDGSIFDADEIGACWSNTVNDTETSSLRFNSSGASMGTYIRADGASVRLIVDGTFTQNEYNSDYSTKTIEHLGLTYGFVYNTTTQKIWLDRNLGATQIATSSTDTNSYGDLYQWGRPFDGHQSRTSSNHDGDTSGKPSTQYETGTWDGKFITTSTPPNDWLSVQDTSLWQNKGSVTSKMFTLQAPTASDDVTIFRTNVAITVNEVIAVSTGNSPSTTYQLKFDTNRNSSGDDLTESGTTTSKTTGNVATLWDNVIPANSWIWLETTAASGTNVYLSIDIRYTED